MVESENKIEYSLELQDLISEVVRENPDIEWRTCNTCGIKLPLHKIFFRGHNKSKIGFLDTCKYCCTKKVVVPKPLTKEELIDMYEDILSGKRKSFLKGSLLDNNNIKIIVRYLLLEKLKLKEKDFIGISLSIIFKKYKLDYLINHFSVYKIIECIPEFNLKIWYLHNVPANYWNNIDNINSAIKWFLMKLRDDNKINTDSDLPKILTHDLVNKYNLGSLLRFKFNNNIYEFLNYMYPNKWKMWNLKMCDLHYWQNEYNILVSINWLIYDKLKIFKRDNLLKLKASDFSNNDLGGMLTTCFKSSVFKALSFAFPELKIREWELHMTPINYWSKKENRIKAFIELVEEKLLLNIDELPNVLSYSFFRKCYPKFASVVEKFYDYNIFNWIDEVYPDIFLPEDFKISIAIDGTKVNSKEELIIHNFLINNCIINNEICYGGNKKLGKYKIYNEEDDEYYLPDWVIDNYYIIEHFGMYYEEKAKQGHIIYEPYFYKTNRKVKFFNKLTENNNYVFIDTYPSDLDNNLYGLKNKLLPLLKYVN